MAAPGPVLVGLSGVVEGESFPLEYGKSVVLGRSRTCDISLRNTRRWMEAEEKGVDPPESSRTVSRKHIKLTFRDVNAIEIEDLSSNGTFIDGKRIDRTVITDVKETGHEIQLGAGDKFRLEWR